MLLHGTESREHCVGLGPYTKLSINGLSKFLERREVLVVETEATKEFPYALNGVELRAVRRKEVQAKPGLLFLAPGRMERSAIALTGIEPPVLI